MGAAQLAGKKLTPFFKNRLSERFISLKYILFRSLSMQISTFSNTCRYV